MGNPERAEQTVEIDGEAYRLQLSINAMCEVEDLLNAGIPRGDPRRIGFNAYVKQFLPAMEWKDVRLVVWAALREHHPDMTIGRAGWLMDRVGWHESTLIMLSLFPGSQPDEADLRALGIPPEDPDRPLKARQNGTGGPSKSKRARSGSAAAPSGA